MSNISRHSCSFCCCLLSVLLHSAIALRADESTPSVDFGPIRVSITNWCVRAMTSEQVWNVGRRIKSNHGFSDAQMTELLSGCLPMLEGRTDYKVSHYHLFGLLERTCGTNSIPVLAQVIRDNRNDFDVWFSYASYCAIADMDEACFTLGSEILDSPNYGPWSRWAVYSRVGRRREKALKNGDQAFLQRCERFYLSRYQKDADFRKHVGVQRWPGPDNVQGGDQ